MIKTFTKVNQHARTLWVKSSYAYSYSLYGFKTFRFNHTLGCWKRYYPEVDKEIHFNRTLRSNEKMVNFRLKNKRTKL